MFLVLFSYPGRIGPLNEAQRSALMGVYGYFILIMIVFLVAFMIRSYGMARVKFGVLKSIDDGRYINIASKSDLAYILAAVITVISFCTEVPKMVKASGMGFFDVLFGKSVYGYVLLGLVLAVICCFYAIFGYRLQEVDLPRKRRGKAHVNVSLDQFLSAFIAHLPTLICVITLAVYMVQVHGMKV